MSKPSNLYFERFCLAYYSDIVDFILKNLERRTTAEEDQLLLDSDPSLDWGMRMAIVYRIEKKKILRSQQHLLEFFKTLLKNTEACLANEGAADDAFRKLTLSATAEEQEWRRGAVSESEKAKLEEAFWYRRLANSRYLKEIWAMVKEGRHI